MSKLGWFIASTFVLGLVFFLIQIFGGMST